MRRKRRQGCVGIMALSCLSAWGGVAPPVFAQGATRNLSAYSSPGVAFTVSVTLDPPAGTGVVGLEDSPPTGWIMIANVSDGGIYDAQNHKVKWGLFSGGDIPAFVTYDITPPDVPGSHCFAGTVTFDLGTWSITGDHCIPIGIPTVSEWGLIVMMLLVVTTGTLVCMRRRPQVQK